MRRRSTSRRLRTRPPLAAGWPRTLPPGAGTCRQAARSSEAAAIPWLSHAATGAHLMSRSPRSVGALPPHRCVAAPAAAAGHRRDLLAIGIHCCCCCWTRWPSVPRRRLYQWRHGTAGSARGHALVGAHMHAASHIAAGTRAEAHAFCRMSRQHTGAAQSCEASAVGVSVPRVLSHVQCSVRGACVRELTAARGGISLRD